MSSKKISKREKEPEPSQHEDDPEINEEEETEAAPTGHDESLKALMKPILAEFIGCFFFLYVSCGAAMSTGAKFETPGTVEIGIALSFGFTIFVIAFTLGHISGAHLNCSVSIALAIVGKISWKRCACYFVAQFFGSMFGTLMLAATFASGYTQNCYASNKLGTGATQGDGVGMEIILTMFLILVVMAATDKHTASPIMVPLCIGLAVTCCHFVALPVTGTSLNPTRSFASAVAASTIHDGQCQDVWNDHWIFWVAPTIGAVSGSVLYKFLLEERARDKTQILERGDARRH